MRRKLCVLLALVQVLMMASACGATVTEPAQTTRQETLPDEPAKQYITVDGKQKERMGTVELTAGYTKDNLVQFTDFYDFGLHDERPLGFWGSVYLNGSKLDSSEYRFDGYPDNTTIVLKLYRGKQLTGNVLTVDADSVIYYDDEAIVVAKTFNAMWDGEVWTAVEE